MDVEHDSDGVRFDKAYQQFAFSVIKAIKDAPDDYNAYHSLKARIIADVLDLPKAAVDAMLDFGGGAKTPNEATQSTLKEISRPHHGLTQPMTMCLRLVIQAAMQEVDPFPGLLAWRPERHEAKVLNTGSKVVFENAEKYMASTLDLFANMLAVNYSVLCVPPLSDEVLVSKGLPSEEPDGYNP